MSDDRAEVEGYSLWSFGRRLKRDWRARRGHERRQGREAVVVCTAKIIPDDTTVKLSIRAE